jgi:hypothetical protein
MKVFGVLLLAAVLVLASVVIPGVFASGGW